MDASLVDDDSASTVLRGLERERGRAFNEKEYQEMRQSVIDELARGPRVRVSLLLTFGVVGLILLSLTLLGVVLAFAEEPEYTLAGAGAVALGVWAYLLRSYLRGVREQSRLSRSERLAEIKQLRQDSLISQQEYDHLFAALHSSRGLREKPAERAL
jgi:hypothetical protein